MKLNRYLRVILIFTAVACSVLSLSRAFAQPVAPTRKEDSFSVKGVITQLDTVTKTVHVKNEGGLELTYHVDDATRISAAEGPGGSSAREFTFSELAVNDPVEIEYRYNENYEKIALSIQKRKPASVPGPAKP